MNFAIKTQITIDLSKATWLPYTERRRLQERVRREQGGKVVRVLKWSRPFRRAMRRSKPGRVSAWAAKNRFLTESTLPGRWKNEITPYLVGIMDAAGLPYVTHIFLCATGQTGKTEAVHNFIGSRIDQAPGPVIYVYPDEKTCKENMSDRIEPMITHSPRLREYYTGIADDKGGLRIRLKHMKIYMAWAGSVSSLANKPARYVVREEVDKDNWYLKRTSKETDPRNLAELRTRTYPNNKKIFDVSTPTTEDGNIWVAITKEAQALFVLLVQCPLCGHWQRMLFDSIKWPEGERDPERVKSEKLAWYECTSCAVHWDDAMRNRAVKQCQWRESKTEQELFAYCEQHRPKKIGFQLPSWFSRFVSLSEVAADFLKANTGNKETDKKNLRHFLNAHKAEPWKHYEAERSEAPILALCDDRPEGLVPGGGMVAGLTAAVDTQDAGFWFEIRAWGWGLVRESWCIRCGYIDSFEALEKILWQSDYSDATGNKYLINFALQDAMGHRTTEVYNFCLMHQGLIMPAQGVERLTAPYSFTRLQTYPGTARQIPGGLQLARVNATHYKNDLSNKLEIGPENPGAWRYYKGLPEQWARQMTAEFRNDQQLWECKQGRANHGWDCSYLNIAAADIIGIKFWEQPEPDEQHYDDGRGDPGRWINNQGGWARR